MEAIGFYSVLLISKSSQPKIKFAVSSRWSLVIRIRITFLNLDEWAEWTILD